MSDRPDPVSADARKTGHLGTLGCCHNQSAAFRAGPGPDQPSAAVCGIAALPTEPLRTEGRNNRMCVGPGRWGRTAGCDAYAGCIYLSCAPRRLGYRGSQRRRHSTGPPAGCRCASRVMHRRAGAAPRKGGTRIIELALPFAVHDQIPSARASDLQRRSIQW